MHYTPANVATLTQTLKEDYALPRSLSSRGYLLEHDMLAGQLQSVWEAAKRGGQKRVAFAYLHTRAS